MATAGGSNALQAAPASPVTGQPRFLVLGHARRRWLRIGAVASVLLYAAACIGAVVFERDLTFVPNPQRTSPFVARLNQVVEDELKTPDGQTLVVWRLAPKPGMPTILYFHGNGETLLYRSGRAAAYEAEGYGLYMMAYRGYSGSTGKPSEAAILADAALAYQTLVGQGTRPEDIFIYGESLGTSVALQTAVGRKAAALILEAPFTSMVDEWRLYAPWLPVRLLLTDKFDSLAVAGKLDMPLLIMHGMRDRLVPFRFGQRIFEAATEPKRFEVFPEAAHTNLYEYNAIAAVRQFIADARAGRLGR